LAGNIAFSSLLAFFPFLIFLTALAGYIGSEHLAQTVVDYLLSVAPPTLVEPLVDDIQAILTVPTPGVLTLSIGMTLYVAAGGVESVRVALNRAYGFNHQDRRIWINRFGQNLLFVIGGAVVLLVLAASIVFGGMGWAFAQSKFLWLEQFSGTFHFLRYVIGLGLFFFALLLGHLFLPAKRWPVITVLPGIVMTMVLWVLAAWLYAEYTARFSRVQIMYAGLGNVVIALMFVYISALLVILGGAFNQVMRMRHRDKKENASRLADIKKKTELTKKD
jgi:membrane protein